MVLLVHNQIFGFSIFSRYGIRSCEFLFSHWLNVGRKVPIVVYAIFTYFFDLGQSFSTWKLLDQKFTKCNLRNLLFLLHISRFLSFWKTSQRTTFASWSWHYKTYLISCRIKIWTRSTFWMNFMNENDRVLKNMNFHGTFECTKNHFTEEQHINNDLKKGHYIFDRIYLS